MSRQQTEVLFRVLSDADEKYIDEADNAPVRSARISRFVYIAAAAAACALFLVAVNKLNGGTYPAKSDQDEQIANPMQQVTDMDEAQRLTGFRLDAPEKLGEYSNRSIIVYDKTMIEADYMNEDGSITGFCVRKAAGTDDVSGDYNEYPSVKAESINGCKVTLKGSDNTISLAVWTANGYSYSLSAMSQPVELSEMKNMISEIK